MHYVGTKLLQAWALSVHNIDQWKPKPSGTMKLTCACAPWYPSRPANKSGTIICPWLFWKRRKISGVSRCRLKAWLESCASWPNTETIKWKQEKKDKLLTWTVPSPYPGGMNPSCSRWRSASSLHIWGTWNWKNVQNGSDIFLKIRQEPLYEIMFYTNCYRLQKIACLLHNLK